MMMKRVDPIDLLHARNNEHFNFMATAIGIFNRSKVAALNLSSYYERFKTLFEQEEEIMKVIRMSENTRAIQELNNECNELFRFIYHTIEMSIRLPDAQSKQAADRLYGLIVQYKDVHTRTQREKTKSIAGLVTDLHTSTYANAIVKLNLSSTVSLLKQKNEQLADLCQNRTDEAETAKALEKLSLLRPDIDEAYNACVEKLNSVYATNEAAHHPTLTIRSMGEIMITALRSNSIQMKQILNNRLCHT